MSLNDINGYGQPVFHYSSIGPLQNKGAIPRRLDLQNIAEIEAVKYLVDRKYGPTRLELAKSVNGSLMAFFGQQNGTIYEINITQFNDALKSAKYTGKESERLKNHVRVYNPSNIKPMDMLLLKFLSIFLVKQKAELDCIFGQVLEYEGIVALIEGSRARNREFWTHPNQ